MVYARFALLVLDPRNRTVGCRSGDEIVAPLFDLSPFRIIGEILR